MDRPEHARLGSSSCEPSRSGSMRRSCAPSPTATRSMRGTTMASARCRGSRAKTGLVRGAAARLVKTARFVARHAQTAKALDAGDVSVPHVEMLAAAAHRRDDLYAEHETVLLDAAATVEVQDFPKAMRRWVSLADDELAQRDAAFGFDRRGILFSPTTGGSVISGFADPEASATVTAVLDDLQPPDGAADTRSVAQRRFDALVLLCERARGGDAARVATDRRRRDRGVRGPAQPVNRSRTSTCCSATSKVSGRSRASPPSASCATARSAAS